MKEQIEKMACAICGNNKICLGQGVKKCLLHPQMRKYAENAYKEGYRKQEWISVEDRLPEESGEYLVFGRTFGNKKPQIWICECISIGSVVGWCNSAKNPIVEAWMPLPEPPKKGGAE